MSGKEKAGMKQSKVIGLTGGSGSGKSTVAKVFAEYGAVIIDADKISHEITDSDETVLAKIRQEFSEDVFEKGILCRKKLGKIVFSDKEALGKLNAILHPAIAEKILSIAKKSTSEIIIIDAPLLFAVKELVEICDEIVTVCAPDDLRINRISARDGITKEEAEKRISAQMPQEKLAEMADVVFVNDGDIGKIRSEIVGYLGK